MLKENVLNVAQEINMAITVKYDGTTYSPTHLINPISVILVIAP